jgi:alanine racemase
MIHSPRYILRPSRRDAWVEVNLDALEHNLKGIRQVLPASIGLMAVLKADAYGHGVANTLPVLEAHGVCATAVASMDEALDIRHLHPTMPVLVLGPTPDWALDAAVAHNITLALVDSHQLPVVQAYLARTSLSRSALARHGASLSVHIKVDTGMHRVGVPWQQAMAFLQACTAVPGLTIAGIFSHLANGDDPQLTQRQHDRWVQVIDAMEATLPPDKWPEHRHLLNAPGLLTYTQSLITPAAFQQSRYHTMARVGLALWGYGWRNAGAEGNLPVLKPVIGLKGRITHLQTLPAGEGVSYGPTYTTPCQKTIATVPFGYADGVPRALSNQLQGLCDGQPIQQVGNITMDQMLWDVTHLPHVAIGDVITVLSEVPPYTLDTWSTTLGTIPYELMCALRVRLPKIVVRR